MFKKELTRSDYFLIAANLLPVAGVWLWGWDPIEAFMVYALETVIIGLFTLIKMGVVTLVRKTDIWYNGNQQTRQSGFLFLFFFLIHYGFFVAVQTGLFIQVSGIGRQLSLDFFSFFLHWPRLFGENAWYIFGGFIISHAFSLYWDFLRPRQYRTISMMILMFQPYARIFIQQCTVILGSMFLSFGAGKIFLLIFVLVKIYVEVFINYHGLINKASDQLKKENNSK